MTPLNNPQTQPLFLVNSIALSDDETHLYAAREPRGGVGRRWFDRHRAGA